jgi:hypothetical protein
MGKEALMDAAWPGQAVEESNLTVQVAALRKALGTTPQGNEWIVTVPRLGYRFIGPDGGEAKGESGKPSIAVLPFANLSIDAEQDYSCARAPIGDGTGCSRKLVQPDLGRGRTCVRPSTRLGRPAHLRAAPRGAEALSTVPGNPTHRSTAGRDPCSFWMPGDRRSRCILRHASNPSQDHAERRPLGVE